jgi:hypothetical protein
MAPKALLPSADQIVKRTYITLLTSEYEQLVGS